MGQKVLQKVIFLHFATHFICFTIFPHFISSKDSWRSFCATNFSLMSRLYHLSSSKVRVLTLSPIFTFTSFLHLVSHSWLSGLSHLDLQLEKEERLNIMLGTWSSTRLNISIIGMISLKWLILHIFFFIILFLFVFFGKLLRPFCTGTKNDSSGSLLAQRWALGFKALHGSQNINPFGCITYLPCLVLLLLTCRCTSCLFWDAH